MATVVMGTREDLGEPLYDHLCRYRHQVFVRKLGWTVCSPESSREEDQFDTEGATYLVGISAEARICGTARLLPTTRPYLLAEIFPDLLDQPAPCSPRVFELSRFAACYADPSEQRYPSGLQRTLFQCAMEAARLQGGLRLVGVMSLAMERVCRSFGARTWRLGPPRVFHGERVVACGLDLTHGLTGAELPTTTLVRMRRAPRSPSSYGPGAALVRAARDASVPASIHPGVG